MWIAGGLVNKAAAVGTLVRYWDGDNEDYCNDECVLNEDPPPAILTSLSITVVTLLLLPGGCPGGRVPGAGAGGSPLLRPGDGAGGGGLGAALLQRGRHLHTHHGRDQERPLRIP